MNTLQRKAYEAGYFDALCRRTYLHSACAGSEIRNNWLTEYKAGWNDGRRVKLGRLLFPIEQRSATP